MSLTETEQFFEHYRTAKGRNGAYLLAADVANPMWDATFSSPAEMRLRKTAELRLIETRIDDSMKGHNTTESLIRQLSKAQAEDLKRISVDSGLAPNKWIAGGRVADEAIRLVDAAIQFNKLPALLFAAQSELKI